MSLGRLSVIIPSSQTNTGKDLHLVTRPYIEEVGKYYVAESLQIQNTAPWSGPQSIVKKRRAFLKDDMTALVCKVREKIAFFLILAFDA